MKRGEKVNSRMFVTVKRIEKVPSQFYAQGSHTVLKVKKKAKTSIDCSLLAQHTRLSDALRFRPALGKDFSGGFMGTIKHWLAKTKTAFVSGVSALRAQLQEKVKELAFAGGVSAAVAVIAIGLLVSTCSIGYVATVDGETVGVLRQKADCQRLLDEINGELAYVGADSFHPGTVSFATKLVPKNGFSDERDIKERLKATDETMIPAYAVYANEEILFALPNKESALSVLEDYKTEFTGGREGVQAEFCEQVTVAHRFVPKKALKTTDSAMEALLTGRETVHLLSENETIDQVAATYGVTVESILRSNYIADEENIHNDRLVIRTGEALLSVKTVELQRIQEEIPFKTIENEDNTKYQGSITVEQEGAPGARTVEAYITAVNGVETDRKVISEQTLSAAVDRVVTKGTKELPPSIGSGRMTMPSDGVLTSRFGSRWGRKHNGIDISADVGTNIYAADNGTVIYSQYNDGGFGYLLQIDHGNGVVTYYAHCNELLVPAGAVVAKGDVIATVGNTGRSTGPHLHFEVHKNGCPVDPTQYYSSIN
ncbi:MAG: M23 family metallopeptidase [Ruminococcaceae bacterium]|nr:M23 family metallopeptidase [Oscillospiraceae bacterium]